MSASLVIGVFIAAAPIGAVSAAEPLQARDLKWDQLPTGRDLALAFPSSAQRANVEGRATLLCQISPERTLDGCSVVSSEPAEFPFGDAAITVAAKFKLSAHQPVAGAVTGAPVTVKIRFNLPRD
jgi:protein TonB